MSKENNSDGLLVAAETLMEWGRPQSAKSLVKYAFTQSPSRELAKSSFWDALRKRDFDFAQLCLDYIEKNGKDSPWLVGKAEKLRTYPVSSEDFAEGSHSVSPSEDYSPISNKVCYILHNAFPQASGGYATRAHGMAKGLIEAGLDVICVTRPGYPMDLPEFQPDGPIQTEQIVDGVCYQNILSPRRFDISEREYVFESAVALEDHFREVRPATVMAASNFVTALPAMLAAESLGIPFVYEVRGFWEVTRASRIPKFANSDEFKRQAGLEATVAKRAKHVFTLTTPMKEELVSRGVKSKKISIAPNSCNPDRFSPSSRNQELAKKYNIPENVPVIGYIGTFAQYEGLVNLAQACAKLVKAKTDFRLLLVGSENTAGKERGPIAEEILRVAQDEGLADKLIMPGRIPHEQVEAHYSLIDIAPFPRKPQPVTEMVSPMKPLEALAMEKVVVASSVRALREMIIDGETGLIFEKGNIQSLSDKLEMLIADDAMRNRLGKAGRQWVEDERTWKKTTQAVADLLQIKN